MNSYNLTGLYEGMEKITFEKPVGENNIQVGGSCPIEGLRHNICFVLHAFIKPWGFLIIVPIVLIIW